MRVRVAEELFRLLLCPVAWVFTPAHMLNHMGLRAAMPKLAIPGAILSGHNDSLWLIPVTNAKDQLLGRDSQLIACHFAAVARVRQSYCDICKWLASQVQIILYWRISTESLDDCVRDVDTGLPDSSPLRSSCPSCCSNHFTWSAP